MKVLFFFFKLQNLDFYQRTNFLKKIAYYV